MGREGKDEEEVQGDSGPVGVCASDASRPAAKRGNRQGVYRAPMWLCPQVRLAT